MTRKHFKLIADAIAEAGQQIYVRGDKHAHVHMSIVINELTRALQQTNPAFKPERFKAACVK